VKYAGVLASASKWRARIAPRPLANVAAAAAPTEETPVPMRRAGTYRPWAELLRRTFSVDVLVCPMCNGRMKLLAMVTDGKSIRRFLASTDEPLDAPTRSANRGPPYWQSTVLRRKAFGDVMIDYLVQIAHDATSTPKVALCLIGEQTNTLQVVQCIGTIFKELFQTADSMEALFLNELQKSEVNLVARPFYVSDGSDSCWPN